MPRGGRFGGGKKQQGPEAYDDEEPVITPNSHKPKPTFPEVHFPTPKPLNHSELASVNRFLEFRNRTRRGAFFATLDPSSLTDENGKVAPRAGFDPFNDQDAYSSRFQKKKRTVPDVGSHDFDLQLFPKELWTVLDPKRKNPLWKTTDPAEFGDVKPRKRKRRFSATEVEARPGDAAEPEDSGEDSDAIVTGRRKATAAKSRKGEPASKQRRGLDAEDDYPEGDRGDAEEDVEGDDEPQDSEFEDSEDEDNDYNAEQYFDDGDDDGMDEDGGGDEGY